MQALRSRSAKRTVQCSTQSIGCKATWGTSNGGKQDYSRNRNIAFKLDKKASARREQSQSVRCLQSSTHGCAQGESGSLPFPIGCRCSFYGTHSWRGPEWMCHTMNPTLPASVGFTVSCDMTSRLLFGTGSDSFAHHPSAVLNLKADFVKRQQNEKKTVSKVMRVFTRKLSGLRPTPYKRSPQVKTDLSIASTN